MDTCICMAETLGCSPETIPILLISYTPIQNLKKKKRKNSGFGLRIAMDNPSLCHRFSVMLVSRWTSLSFNFLNSKMGRVTKAILVIFTGLKIAHAKHLAAEGIQYKVSIIINTFCRSSLTNFTSLFISIISWKRNRVAFESSVCSTYLSKHFTQILSSNAPKISMS